VPTPGSSAFAASTLNSPKVDPPRQSRSDSGAIRRKRVAFVVQRCGLEVNGGAELLCWQVAERMAEHWQTEIITTCALDYMTWNNHYPAGTGRLGSVAVHRFPVDQPRDVENFNRLSAELRPRQKDATLAEQENWMRAQGPLSSGLLDYLRDNKRSYDAFIFFGYLYATSYFGLPLVAEKAWLEPLAHDEWPIHFGFWDSFFSLPRGFIFNTDAEREFLRGRFPGNALAGPIAGIGIDNPPPTDTAAFKVRYNLDAPFLLYVGRVDESKGCSQMFDYFVRWKKESNKPHKLVIVGQEIMPIPFHDDIIHLGFVSDQEKWAAMKSCDWLIMPSPYESLSMVLLEAWSVGRPVLVNGGCEVLRRHCQESHGGLWFRDFDEWSAALSVVDEDTRHILGRQGKDYVRQRYSWEQVEGAYLKTLKAIAQ
jgi:glycosyltransferase involved in cell wall biosynthesis